MKKMRDMKKILLSIEYDDVSRLDWIRRNRGITSRSDFIRDIIKNYLKYQKAPTQRLHKDMFGKFAHLYKENFDSLNIQTIVKE